MKKSIFGFALFLLLTVSSFAQVQDFTLINGCDFVISYVYISPSSETNWGEDVLTVDVLGSGEECEIEFSGHEECLWDIKAVADDGSEAVWTGIDLCEYFSIKLTMTEDGPYAVFDAE